MTSFNDSKRDGESLFSVLAECESVSYTESEKQLMMAVLKLAMEDATKSGYLRENALTFFREQESEYIFSFPVICQQLGLSQSRILKSLGLVRTEAGEGLARA